jgi:hypothetical protein
VIYKGAGACYNLDAGAATREEFFAMKMMMRIAALMILLVLVACSQKGFHVDIQPKPVPGVDWSKYSTWSFGRQGEYVLTGNEVLDDASFRKSVGENTIAEMSKLGYKHVDSDPELLLMFHVIVEQRFDEVKLNPAYQEYDMEWAQVSEDDTWQEGSLALFAIDAKTGAQVWGSVARAELDKHSTFDTKKTRFNQVVSQMLADFPKRSP